MKRILMLAVIAVPAVLSFVETSAQSDPIATIRQQYASINRSSAKYRKVKKELSGFSLEGGHLVAYFQGPSIMRIVATYFGESGKATEEYYYSNEKLIFVFRKDSRYDSPLSGKVVATTEERFYYQNDKLIRWIDQDGKQADPTTSEFNQKETEYLASSKQFTDGARAKNRAIEHVP